jgi:hypothetical protein
MVSDEAKGFIRTRENIMACFDTNGNDAATVERIRREYLSREENKIDQLRRLDEEVKRPGTIVAITVGTIGALVMGVGMCMVMVWSIMVPGIIVGILGMLIAGAGFFANRSITIKRKERYAAQIMQLSDEIDATRA